MKLQFAAIERTMSSRDEEAVDPSPLYSSDWEYRRRYKVDVRNKSLGAKSDPLYFAPFLAKSYPLYKGCTTC